MDAAALKIIENYCKRTFTETTYTNEEYKGSGTEYLNLKNYPIITFTKIEENGGIAGVPSWTEVENIHHIDNTGQLYYEGGFFAYERAYRVTYKAGFTTLPADITYCVTALSTYLTKQSTNAGIKKESLGEYNYERFESSGNIIKDLGLNTILDAYRTPTV